MKSVGDRFAVKKNARHVCKIHYNETLNLYRIVLMTVQKIYCKCTLLSQNMTTQIKKIMLIITKETFWRPTQQQPGVRQVQCLDLIGTSSRCQSLKRFHQIC